MYGLKLHSISSTYVTYGTLQGAMMSIAFKEGLKIAPQAMEQIIIGANQDVRQVRLL